MELTYDWRSFQGMFYPNRRSGLGQGSYSSGPVYVIIENDAIISAFAETEDLSEWVGGSFRELQAKYDRCEVIAFDRASVDGWIRDGSALPHFYDQVEFLRSQAAVAGPKQVSARKTTARVFPRHFVIEAIYGWWSRLFPSSYGVFVRIESQPEQDILLLVRRGALVGFHRPDLSSLGQERRRQPQDVVKYLSERYLVAVQGFFVTPNDWYEWSRDPNPWRKVAAAVRANRTKMFPFRWGLALLVSVRAFFGI